MPVIVFLSRLPGPRSHSVYIVTLYLALHHPEAGDMRCSQGDWRGFCEYQGNKDRETDKTKRPLLWNAIQKFNFFPNYSFVLILNFSIYMQNKVIWGNLLNWKNKITNNRTSLKRHKILSIAKIPFPAKKMLKVAL